MGDATSRTTPNDRRWWQKVLSRVARAVHDPSEAEDYLHTAFLRLEAYRVEHHVRNPAAFLVRTAVNLAIDESRRRRILNERNGSIVEMFDIADDQPLQSEVLAARKRLKHVQEALDRLPPRTREAFLMHRVDGLKYKEIALELNISVSSVEKHIAKAALLVTKWTEGW